MRRNKIIISTLSISIVLFFFFLALSNCEFTGELSFHYIENKNTGEQMSLFVTIVFLLFIWWVLSLIPASCMFLFAMSVYFFLHRKDKKLLIRGYNPPYESELYFGCTVAMTATFIATFILMLLFSIGLIVVKQV